MLAIRTIIHPTDFSPAAENAYRVALALARDHEARLIVLHVASRDAIHAGVKRDTPLAFEEYHDPLWERLLAHHDMSLADPVEHDLREGHAASEILQAAKEFEADLIVMGATGRSDLGRFLLGRVTETVMRQASCPVLTMGDPAGHRSAHTRIRGIHFSMDFN